MKEKIIEATIHPLFATPVYATHLNRELSNIENKFIQKNKSDTYNNQGNTTSNNSYVLNNKKLINIKKKLDKTIADYFNRVSGTTDKIKPYITQSWLNYTKENQYHHQHTHGNSLISGILYINADEKNDNIMFYDNKHSKIIMPTVKSYNIFNSLTWSFVVKTGDILLFPSNLGHSVQTKKGKNLRISLSFNVFVKGQLGVTKNLDELIL
jgi:uncharacterized protein (TIGR02466 family)|tara:strand:+ start:93 stop:722 length:630 start_codon:yes stop_codon:yes gene_type:complete